MGGEKLVEPAHESRSFRERAADAECGNCIFLDALDDGVLADFLEGADHRQLVVRQFDASGIRQILPLAGDRQLHERQYEIPENEQYYPDYEHDELSLSSSLAGTGTRPHPSGHPDQYLPDRRHCSDEHDDRHHQESVLIHDVCELMGRHRLDFLFVQLVYDPPREDDPCLLRIPPDREGIIAIVLQYPDIRCRESPRDAEILHDIIELRVLFPRNRFRFREREYDAPMESECDEAPHEQNRPEEQEYPGNVIEGFQRIHPVYAYIRIRTGTRGKYFCRSHSDRFALRCFQRSVYSIVIEFPSIATIVIPEIMQTEKYDQKHPEKQDREERDEQECFEPIGPNRRLYSDYRHIFLFYGY